jgi:hypothetical protein
MLALSLAVGVVVVSLAQTSAQTGVWWSEIAFWVGLTVLFVPAVLALMSSVAGQSERLTAIALIGLALYAVKILRFPTCCAHDELTHLRSALTVVETSHLFGENTMLPVSPLYPGLEILSTALSGLAGLDLVPAGILVIGVGRLILVLSLFLLFEIASGSPRVAGIGTLLYMANPEFLYFDAQIAYESLAIPLAAATLLVIARAERARGRVAAGLHLLAILLIAAVAVTHHVTAYALSAFLVLWGIVNVGLSRRRRFFIAGYALAAIVANAAWLVYLGGATIPYIGIPLANAVADVLRLIAGEGSARELFRSPTGTVAPFWERVFGFGSVVLILASLPFGLFAIYRRLRTRALPVALGLAALAYGPSLALRLTESGAETSNRASEFVFLGVGFALGMAADAWMRAAPTLRQALFLGWASVIFLGGVIVGVAPWARIPGPYVVGADSRSIQPESIEAAEWARRALGPNNRIIADRTNWLVMGTYGRQTPVAGYVGGRNLSSIFLSPQLGARERALLRDADIDYIIVDRRLTTDLPALGIYFESSDERLRGPYRAPLDPQLLAKFETARGITRVFDSGDIVIYDVREFRDEQ